MSSRSASPSSASPRVQRLLTVLHRSLDAALRRERARRYDTHLSLRRVPGADEDDATMQLRLDVRGLLRLRLQVRVIASGDDVSTLHCAIEDGPSRRYSYALDGRGGTTLSHAPELGRAVATFLLGEVERRLGRRLLQSAAAPPTQTILPDA